MKHWSSGKAILIMAGLLPGPVRIIGESTEIWGSLQMPVR